MHEMSKIVGGVLWNCRTSAGESPVPLRESRPLRSLQGDGTVGQSFWLQNELSWRQCRCHPGDNDIWKLLISLETGWHGCISCLVLACRCFLWYWPNSEEKYKNPDLRAWHRNWTISEVQREIAYGLAPSKSSLVRLPTISVSQNRPLRRLFCGKHWLFGHYSYLAHICLLGGTGPATLHIKCSLSAVIIFLLSYLDRIPHLLITLLSLTSPSLCNWSLNLRMQTNSTKDSPRWPYVSVSLRLKTSLACIAIRSCSASFCSSTDPDDRVFLHRLYLIPSLS